MLLNTQRLLFEERASLQPGVAGVSVPPEFYDQGCILLHDVPGIEDAIEIANTTLSSLDGDRVAYLADLLPRLQLAKADRLPCREPDIHESFQALHFDMGLPLVAREYQVGYLFAMLYSPHDRQPGQAQTRIAGVEGVLRQRRRHALAECEGRLQRYADTHGDGWTQPEPHITGRVGCFARLVDAMLDEHELTHLYDQPTWEWFREGEGSEDGRRELAAETTWLSGHGHSLPGVETRIQLEPGDLLLFNNISCAHGRLGRREPEELWQVMWGVPHVDADEIAKIRGFVAAAMAGG